MRLQTIRATCRDLLRKRRSKRNLFRRGSPGWTATRAGALAACLACPIARRFPCALGACAISPVRVLFSSTKTKYGVVNHTVFLFGRTEGFRGPCAAGAYSQKVGRQQSDSECACKRAERLAVTFCEKGGTVKRVTDFLCNKKSEQAKLVPTWLPRLDSNQRQRD